MELIARIRTRVIQSLNRPVEVVSCCEAGYDGFWLHRLLEAHDIRNYVIDPASVQVDRRARRVKTDNIDVGRLLRSLMAYLRGEPKVRSVVRVPSVAEEDDRRLHRERDRLINERIQHVNRIKGLCAVHGIYDYEPIRPNRLARLEQMRAADGREVRTRFKAEILRELQRLELVLNMIKTIEAERDAIVSAGKSSMHANAKKIQDLVKLKSIGPEISTTLVGEVFYRRFNNRQQLGSYVGIDAEPFPERSHELRSGYQQGWQSQGPHHHDRAGLVVVALPAQQSSEYLVPRACRDRQGPHPAHRHRCHGAQAFDHPVALPGNRRGANGYRSEGLIRAWSFED